MAEGLSNDIRARFLQPGMTYVERERESNLVCYVAMQDDISVQFSLHLATEKNYCLIYYRATKNN